MEEEGEGSSFEYNSGQQAEDEDSEELMEKDNDQMEMSEVNGYSDLSEEEDAYQNQKGRQLRDDFGDQMQDDGEQEEEDCGHDQEQESEDQEECEEDNGQSEEGDQVNEMSFTNNQLYGENKDQVSQEEEEEEESHEVREESLDQYGEEGSQQSEDDGQDEESEEEDQEVGEMKAKFDKIMANFVEESKSNKKPQTKGSPKVIQPRQPPTQSNQERQGINDYKEKNMQNNVKGLFRQIAEEDSTAGHIESDSQEEIIDAYIEGPNKENNEMSVNIKINKKNIFNNNKPVQQAQQNTKPPKPILKANNLGVQQHNNRSSTPDREKPMRQKMNLKFDLDNQENKENRDVKSNQRKTKPQPSHPNFGGNGLVQKPVLKRPQTAKPLRTTAPTQNNLLLVEESEDFNNLLSVQKRVEPQRIIKRPTTAYSQNLIKPQTQLKKKSDPVSRYQNMQNEWKSSQFLKANKSKQGRKLDLDRFHRWSSLVHAHNTQLTKIKKSEQVKPTIVHKGPVNDRRDDLRFQLRAKISQKDYVNKDMKNFHYKQDMKAGNADKIEMLKKQINSLKNCIDQ